MMCEKTFQTNLWFVAKTNKLYLRQENFQDFRGFWLFSGKHIPRKIELKRHVKYIPQES